MSNIPKGLTYEEYEQLKIDAKAARNKRRVSKLRATILAGSGYAGLTVAQLAVCFFFTLPGQFGALANAFYFMISETNYDGSINIADINYSILCGMRAFACAAWGCLGIYLHIKLGGND